MFHTLAIDTVAAIGKFAENPGSYQPEKLPAKVFKKMCANCNVLMEQVCRIHGWADPKDGFVDHGLGIISTSTQLTEYMVLTRYSIPGADNIVKAKKKCADKAKMESKVRSKKAGIKAKAHALEG